VDHVVSNASFRAVFHVKGGEGHTLAAPGASLWPTFTPFAGMEWMTEGVEIHPVDDGFLVVVDALAFEPDPLPVQDEIGGLLQVQVDGMWVATEVGHAIPWAAEGVTVSASTSPLWAMIPDEEAAAQAPAPDERVVIDEGTDPAVEEEEAPAAGFDLWALLTNLGLGFLGGLILNVMPCVLPVLMLKLYSLVEQGGISDADKRTAGLAYTGGILVSFWVLGLAVLGMRVFGTEVGWGFQMQEPGYVAGLATLVFVFSLSLFGVFEVPAFGVESATELGSQEGVGGYFFTGVFATLVATPCSAPILGAATAFAFSAPTAVLFLVFSAIGLGLAFPFLMVAFIPAAYKLLPQPGGWMESFKEFLGFTLVVTTLWLVGVMMSLTGPDRTFWFLAFLVTVSFGAWIFGHFAGVAAEGKRQLQALGVALGVCVLGGWYFLDLELAEDVTCDDSSLASDLDFSEHIPWQAFSEDRVAALAGKTVFIDFTADWCVSCKANERTILETQTVRAKMAALGVVPLKADWTRRNAVITEWLNRYDRVGVPMYLVIPPAGAAGAFTLPEVITPGMVNDALVKASSMVRQAE
jgi:thiol:disulfide interchange protein DsbD